MLATATNFLGGSRLSVLSSVTLATMFAQCGNGLLANSKLVTECHAGAWRAHVSLRQAHGK